MRRSLTPRLRAPSVAAVDDRTHTNILIRYLAQDDPIQSPQATEIFQRRLTEQNPGYICVVAMAETVWVLQRSYGLTDPAVVEIIERLLQSDVLVIENEQEVFAAATALKDGRGSFADGLIGSLDAKAGCSHTLTFDRRAWRLPGFTPP